MTVVDTFLSDTEAPSLGLYLVRVPSGIAYEVKREAGDHSVNTGVDETLFCGSRAQVKLFLRGYAAAQAPAATCIGCCKKVTLIDSAWLYGRVCADCIGSVIDDVEAAVTAREWEAN